MADERKNDSAESSGAGSTGSASAGGPKHVEQTRALRLEKPPQLSERELRERQDCIDRTHKAPPLKEGSHPRGLPKPEEIKTPPTTPGQPKER